MSNTVPSTEVDLPEIVAPNDVPAVDLIDQPQTAQPIFESEQRRQWEDPARYSRDRNEESKIEWEANRGEGVFGTIGNFNRAVERQFFHGGNIAESLYSEYRRKSDSGESDPSWDDDRKNEFLKENLKEIGSEQAWRFWGTKNQVDAAGLLQEMQADKRAMRVQSEMGFKTQLLAGFTAGLADVDAPLMLMSGGLGPAAKAGLAATRVGRMAMGVASGALTGTALGLLDQQVNPLSEASDVALYGVMGAGFGLFGSLVGGAPKDLTHTIRRDVQEEIGENLQFMQARQAEVHADARSNWSIDEGFDAALADELGSPSGGSAGSKVELDLDEVDASTGAASREPGTFAVPEQGPGSVGAAAVGGGPNQRTGTGALADDYKGLVDIAERRDRELGVTAEWRDPDFNFKDAVTEGAGRMARRFAQMAQRMGIGTDHGKGMNSQSPIVRMFTYDVLESGSGIARNANSAAILRETYRTELSGAFAPFYDEMKKWKAAQGYTMKDDVWPINKGPNSTEMFNREVIKELMARAYGGKGSTDEFVKKAADAHDKMYALDIEVGAGRGGETPMDAYKGMTARSGYVQQRWSGRNMQKMIDEAEIANPGKGGNARRLQIEKSIREEYKRQYPAMKAEERRIIAAAVVDRALTNNSAISRNLLTLLNGDEAPFIKARLSSAGFSEDAIKRTLDGLMGARAEKGQPAHTKARYDVDFRTSSNGIDMMDLLDVNLADMAERRMAKTSGLGALARKGLTSREKFEEIKIAAIADQKARGVEVLPTVDQLRTTSRGDSLKDQAPDLAGAAKIRATDELEAERPVDEQWFDDMYSYFNGTPVAGGISPVYARMKKLTSLALMNQLGLTQLAEFGAIAAGVGLNNFMEHAGVMFKKASSDKNSPLMQEMSHFHVFVPEENTFRPDLTFESEKINGKDNSFMRGVDNLLNKGQRLQGYVSGFYAVRGAQQKMALSAGTARLFESIKAGGKGQWTDMRLKDMGINLELYEDLIKKGIPEFDSNGKLVKMNLEKWDYDTLLNYRTSMHRLTGQLIQKAMIGESNAMFHKDGMAQLFWQFKSFPLLSLEKQFARNMRFADSAAINTFMFGTVTAGLAYSARQLANGRTDNLTTEKIARGAINYSNMAGWIGMWTDPVAGMLGMDPIMSGFNPMGSSSVIPVPAAFGTLDKMIQAPANLARVALSPTGVTEYTNEQLRTLTTIPIVGGMLGMSFLLNTFKHERTAKEKGVVIGLEPTKKEAEAAPVGGLDPAGLVNSMLGM